MADGGHAPCHKVDMTPLPTEATNHRGRILVVDDDNDMADATAELLRLEGHIVLSIYGGEEAVEVARDFKPNLVILDLSMPGLDGYATAAMLRKDQSQRPMILVAHTGDRHLNTPSRAQAAGFDYHLVKPALPERLFALAAASVSQQELPGHLRYLS